MANNESSFSDHAGTVHFPRSTADLTSVTQCPACFAALVRAVCPACGLDLNHPAAAELAATSATAAGLLDDRRELIGRMRFATAKAEEEARLAALAAAEEQAAAAFAAYEKTLVDAAAASPTTVAAPIPAPASIPVYAPMAEPAAPSGSQHLESGADPVIRRLRSSSIQVLLLIAGVSLVSLAAVLFIIYAFINFGIEWRSAIIAAVTVATFTIASLLRRRGYTATAEGVGVFAVVLVYLDAYAVRANDLFGSQASDPEVYWGVTLLGSALGFILWHRLSGLRVASVAGFAAVAPGAAILLYGLGAPLDQPVRVFLSFAAMAAAGLLHPLAARSARVRSEATAGLPERSIVLCIAALGILAAVGSAFFIDTSFWGATIALGSVAVIGAAHAVVSLGAGSQAMRAVELFGRGLAVVAAIAAAAAFAATLLQDPDPAFAVIVPAVAATVVALGLDTVWRRLTSPAARRVAGSATIGALVVAGALALAPVLMAALPALSTAVAGVITPWTLAFSDAVALPTVEWSAAVAAVAIMAAIAIGFSAASGALQRRFVALVAIGGAAVVLAVPLLAVTWVVTTAWLAIGAVALALVILGAWRWQIAPGVRRAIGAAAIGAIALGYLVSWASVDTWLAGSLATVALVFGARFAFGRTDPVQRAALLGGAVVLGIVATVALAQQLTLDSRSIPDYSNSVRFVSIYAIGLLALGSVSSALRLTPPDRRTIFWIAFPTAVVTTFLAWLQAGAGDLLLAEHVTSLLAGCALILSLVLWMVLRANADVRAERIAASIALAPAAFVVADATAQLSGVPAFSNLAAVGSALLVAAAALVVSILRPTDTPRRARELGILIVLVPSLIVAVRSSHDQTWLVLILAGATVLLSAISADGLFGSGSGRKHLGWVALALGTSGLWWRLSADTVDDVEPYVLPLAGALLIIALLVWRAQPREPAVPGSAAAPMIALGGLLVAVLPIASAGATGALGRAIVIAAVSVALLLGGSLVRAGARLQPYLDAAATAGALGLLTIAVGRIALSIPLSDVRVDAWLCGAFLALFAAGFGQSLRRDPGRLRSIVGQALAAVAIATVLVILLVDVATTPEALGDLSRLRALCWAVGFTGIAITALTIDRGPLRTAVGWMAVGAVGFLVFAALIAATLTVFEAASLLVVLALASSAAALVVTLLRISAVPRLEREIGMAVVGLMSLLLLAGNQSDDAWLVLEIAAVGALTLAISRDGLFGARSPRKHVGWLALALAVGGLWWRLSGSEVRDLEPYVLPVAGALLLVALLSWRARQADADSAGAPPVIAGAALLVAILPLALNGASGPIARPIVVGLVSAALLIVGSVVVGSPRLRPYLNAAAAVGAVGVLTVTIGRAWFIAREAGTPELSLDAWLGAALAVLLVAAFGQARARDADAVDRRPGLAQALLVAGLTVVLVFEGVAIDDSILGFTRALATLLLFCGLHVACVALNAAPFTRLVAWTVLALGVIAASLGIAASAFDEIEFASVPIALALIAGGLVRLRRAPETRSWPQLGAGLLLLLVPSLIAAIEDRPIWRIAAIAVVAILMTVLGLVKRSQAPFIVGALVTITHTITTFSPQLRELYEVHSWLVWIAIGTIGGTVLIVLAARFEKSLNTARSTLRRVGDLR